MAWYIRKSFRVGKLLRLNLSKSGVGFSVGVKGARVGINAQGKPYTHVGRHGLYNRKTYGRTRPAPTSPSDREFLIAVLALVPSMAAGIIGGWLAFFIAAIGTVFLVLVLACSRALFPGLIGSRRSAASQSVNVEEKQKRQWEKKPMTDLQEAHISHLFDERELPRTAKYTDATSGLAAFKNAYGRQVTQDEAAGLISFLEGLPIKETQTRNTTKTPIITFIVIALMFAGAILISLTTRPMPEARVTTESKGPVSGVDYRQPQTPMEEKRIIEMARSDIKAGFVSGHDRLIAIPKDSPNYAEARSLLSTITPQMIKLDKERRDRADAKQKRYNRERQESIDRLYKKYEWCMGASRSPWLEHKDRAHAYLEFLMKEQYLKTHSNLKGWTTKWRP